MEDCETRTLYVTWLLMYRFHAEYLGYLRKRLVWTAGRFPFLGRGRKGLKHEFMPGKSPFGYEAMI